MTDKKPLTVGVTGGRNYEGTRLYRALNLVNRLVRPITTLSHGAARGADSVGQQWAKDHKVRDQPFPARWNDLSHPDAVIRRHPNGRAYDAKAGHRRNQEHLDKAQPDIMVAAPGNRGTRDMLERTHAAGIRVLPVRELERGPKR